jgi:hypothetical protein
MQRWTDWARLGILGCAAICWAVPCPVGQVTFGAPPAKDDDAARTANDDPAGPAQYRQQVEADWLRQDEVRVLPATAGGVTTREDAAGGCDGVKDGKWGFHTNHQPKPWWQVDLGRVYPLDQVLIYNRCDGYAQRAARLIVLLSADGTSWKEAYVHAGAVFNGASDNKPLAVELNRQSARYVRLQLPTAEYFHLDEVEVYSSAGNYQRNVALGRPADQSSTSPWSKRAVTPLAGAPPTLPVGKVVERGLRLAAGLQQAGVETAAATARLRELQATAAKFTATTPASTRQAAYFEAQWAIRALALANPLLDFDRLVFVKRVPGSYAHMSDQNYGWFSRPGGGLYVLEGFKSGTPRLRCLTAALPPGSVTNPDLSYDGKRVLFAYCRHYPHVVDLPNKLDKSQIPEDAFYHLYEVDLDGTGLKRLTKGKYDDFDGRYLPSGAIAFLSTRRGQEVQCGPQSASASCAREDLPDSYVRCGGGSWRPVAVYTLHVMAADGTGLAAISPFENFEWTPSIADDGRILYSRWDYVDRDNMPYMSIWSTLPDGSAAQAVFGNYTINPYAMFEARSIPKSHKLVFTASAHHSITAGSLVLLDPLKGADGPGPMTRLTPEVPFPEVEGWPAAYYANPFPLSEDHYLVAWSDQRLVSEGERARQMNPPNAMGIYLYDAFGNLNLLYRDPAISSMYPVPVRPRGTPPAPRAIAQKEETPHGRMLLLDVYDGLAGVPRGTVKSLRLVGVPAKVQPTMNEPPIGITRDDPGKFVLGTVPVESDGSAYFNVPAGVPFFLQALDAEGLAVQTMRSVTYVQPGQTYSCIGCHEHRHEAPANASALATQHAAVRLAPGPSGSWPLDYTALVQPVLDRHCVGCHKPGGEAADTDLRAAQSYETLIAYGGARSLRNYVLTAYRQGTSTVGAAGARSSALWGLLSKGHYQVTLTADDRARLATWMDVYAQRSGSFSPDQDRRLRELRARLAAVVLR